MTPLITIAAQCHNFQHRLCWMLSSLLQQTQPGLLTVDIACLAGNGSPTTEQTVAAFQPQLDVRLDVWPDREQFQYRGLIRNRQLTACSTEWLLFADGDMVYHPEYFERLAAELEANHKAATYMLSSGRISNPKEEANAMVWKWKHHYPAMVPYAWTQSDVLTKIERSNVGAGFCQLINKNHAPHAGYYVDPTENRDWNWNRRGSNPKSDIQFRRRIALTGGERRALPDWFTQNAIHLNHHRDPDLGVHLNEQR